jgi:hypothetical protein
MKGLKKKLLSYQNFSFSITASSIGIEMQGTFFTISAIRDLVGERPSKEARILQLA